MTAWRGAGRHRALAGADRRARPARDYVMSRRGALPATRSRSRPMSASSRAAAGGGGRLVADRAVRADDPPRAHRRHARELRFRRRRHVMAYFKRRLAQAPRDADFALELRQGACAHARPAGGLRRGGALQVRRAVGAARRAPSRLCRRRASPAGRVPAGGDDDERSAGGVTRSVPTVAAGVCAACAPAARRGARALGRSWRRSASCGSTRSPWPCSNFATARAVAEIAAHLARTTRRRSRHRQRRHRVLQDLADKGC